MVDHRLNTLMYINVHTLMYFYASSVWILTFFKAITFSEDAQGNTVHIQPISDNYVHLHTTKFFVG